MAHINLLPWREELRRQRQKEFGIMAALGVVAALGILGLMHLQVNAMIDHQESRNARLELEIKKLDKKIEEIKDLEKERENLIARMRVVEQLQTSRPEVVHLFDEIVTALPEGVYLKQLTQKGRTVTLKGVAQSNARVSSFMRGLENSKWLESPDLKMIKATGKEDATGYRLGDFELVVQQTQPKAPAAEEN